MDIPDIATWQIVKWVLIVLIAAFIGQFGKTFAQYLMGGFRGKKVEAAAAEPPEGTAQESEVETGIAVQKGRKKEEKTRLKAQKKAEKDK